MPRDRLFRYAMYALLAVGASLFLLRTLMGVIG